MVLLASVFKESYCVDSTCRVQHPGGTRRTANLSFYDALADDNPVYFAEEASLQGFRFGA